MILQSLHGQFSSFQVFIFDLNSFSDALSFSLLGKLFNILEPTRVSILSLTVRMFRDLNLSLFLRGYQNSIKSKTSFMISGVSFILTLNISKSNFCELRLWILKELSFAKSSLNVELWSWYAILKALECNLYGCLIYDSETSKRLDHKKI